MKGKTYAWQRPWTVEVKIESSTVEAPKLLRDFGFTSGIREAKELVSIGHMWVDNLSTDGVTIWDRMFKWKDEIVDINEDTIILVGKNPMEAACHRIYFVR